VISNVYVRAQLRANMFGHCKPFHLYKNCVICRQKWEIKHNEWDAKQKT